MAGFPPQHAGRGWWVLWCGWWFQGFFCGLGLASGAAGGRYPARRGQKAFEGKREKDKHEPAAYFLHMVMMVAGPRQEWRQRNMERYQAGRTLSTMYLCKTPEPVSLGPMVSIKKSS